LLLSDAADIFKHPLVVVASAAAAAAAPAVE